MLFRSAMLEKTLSLMSQLKVPQTISSFTSVLQVFATMGDVKRMEAIVMVMEERGIPPNREILESFLIAHANLGKTDKVEQTLQRMTEGQYPPTNSTYRLLIQSYHEKGNYEALFQLFGRLRETPSFEFSPEDLQLFSEAYQSSFDKDYPEMDSYFATFQASTSRDS